MVSKRWVAIVGASIAQVTHGIQMTFSDLACREIGRELMPQPMIYRIYIVSIWAEPAHRATDAIHWRFRVEDPRTGAQVGFGSAAALADFLATPEQFESNPLAPNDFQMIDGYAPNTGIDDSEF